MQQTVGMDVASTYMRSEILEQPEVLERLLEAEGPRVDRIAGAIRAFDPYFVMMVARGSSDNAALYGKYLLGAINRLPVALAAPSLVTLYRSPPNLSRALVIAISQSGRSPDLLEVVCSARRQGAMTVAATNNPSSPLAERCEWVIPLHAGRERSVAATKSYTAQLLALAMLSASLSVRPELAEELRALPESVQLALEAESAARKAALWLKGASRCVVIGRGFDYATAQEIALKLKELAAVAAEPYSAADFMHGPVAMVEPGFPAVLVAHSGAAYREMRRLAARLQRLGADLIAISDRRWILDTASVGLPVGSTVSEWLSPLVSVVPGQMLALHLAVEKGMDPDRPRRLTKVTRTR